MQEVALYSDYLEAKQDMDRHIRLGWRIQTCTSSTYKAGCLTYHKVLVVYEKGGRV